MPTINEEKSTGTGKPGSDLKFLEQIFPKRSIYGWNALLRTYHVKG